MRARVIKVLKNPLFSGSLVMIVGSMAVNAINYFYHLIMGRLLGPVGYGVLASLFSVFYITSVVPISTSFAIIKFISNAKNEKARVAVYKTIRRFIFYLAAVTSVILFISSPLISNFLHIGELSTVMLLAPLLFVTLITLVNSAALQGMLRFKEFVTAIFVSSFFKLVLGVTFVFLGYYVFGAFGAMIISGGLAYLYTTLRLREFSNIKTTTKFNLRPFLHYAFPVLVQALAFTSIFSTDLILVKHFLPPFEAGLYAALSTLGKIVFFASQPVTAVMFPIVSGRISRGERYKEVFFASFFLTVFISISVVMTFFFFPKLVIGIPYGKDYLGASAELVWMGAFISVYTVNYMIVNFLLSINRLKIVVLPLTAAIVQIAAIWTFHESMLQIIQISLLLMTLLFATLSLYLGYNNRRVIASFASNRLAKAYASKKV